MTNEALLTKVPLPVAQVHRMAGELEPEVAAAQYEALLRARVPAGGRGDAGVRPGAAGDGRRWAYGVPLSTQRCAV